MQYRKDPITGNEISALGFGCMRFPGTAGRIDIDACEELLRYAIGKGVNYLDTAYVYNGSEQALGQVFARNPGMRDKVFLATKLPVANCKSASDFDEVLATSLKRLGTDHVDYYLIHNLSSVEAWRRLDAVGIKEWISHKKGQSAISSIGFSYHGTEADFPTLLDAYDWDFCQIQYNYMNEHYQAGTSGLKAAAARGLPVFVMEPLLGGKLAAKLPNDAEELLESAGASSDPVRLALRWVLDHPEVTMVLSGMNALDQVSGNIDAVEDAIPGSFSKTELIAVEAAIGAITKDYKVPCTGCGYCLPCPEGVNIPMCFASYNSSFAYGRFEGIKQYVTGSGAFTGDAHYASDCVKCGKCASKCPQHIDIPGELESAKRRLQIPGMPAILRLGVRLFSR